MNQKKPCKLCNQFGHYPYMCRLNPKKPKRITKFGKKAREYAIWRDEVAKPYLIAKDGYKCSICGSGGKLDIDHIAKRRMGGAPSRTMNLNNIHWLCRTCHIDIT